MTPSLDVATRLCRALVAKHDRTHSEELLLQDLDAGGAHVTTSGNATAAELAEIYAARDELEKRHRASGVTVWTGFEPLLFALRGLSDHPLRIHNVESPNRRYAVFERADVEEIVGVLSSST